MRGDLKIPSFFYSMITKQLVRKLAEERIDELDRGLFIVNISISSSFVIHLELDKTEGYVAIEDCISVSRNVEHNLDRESQDFELHVSSAMGCKAIGKSCLAGTSYSPASSSVFVISGETGSAAVRLGNGQTLWPGYRQK